MKEASLTTYSATLGTVDWEQALGRTWLTAPVVALVPGVLNGELVPSAEVAQHVEAWNGRPVILDHPTNGDGVPISANEPSILAERQVGQLFYTVFEDGRLKAEVWIDPDLAASHGKDGAELLDRLRSGDPIEVSTAYFRDVLPRTGIYEDEPYVGVSQHLKPDHLAILLHAAGACSWESGCGLPRVNDKESGMKVNVLSKARKPSYTGTEDTSWADVDKTFSGFMF